MMKLNSSMKWILSAVALALTLRVFVISVYKVPTVTMAPTLLPGDYILSYQLAYGFKFPWMSEGYFSDFPQRGDVVVFKKPDKPGTYFVKRIVALPQDRVAILNGHLILNGQQCDYQDRSETDSISSENFYLLNEHCLGLNRDIVRIKSQRLTMKDFSEIKLNAGEYFVLGDNRDTSEDSRDWGPIKLEQVSSKVQLIWMSLGSTQDSISKEKGFRFSRFLTRVH